MQPIPTIAIDAQTPLPTPLKQLLASVTPVATRPEPATPTLRTVMLATPTLRPTSTQTPIPTATIPPTPLSPCTERIPADSLLTIVTRQYPISADYVPADLVPLSDYFAHEITFGYGTHVRAELITPLLGIMQAMDAAEGLAPTIISGYRSYSTQAIAREKWEKQYPDRVDQLSAPPGTSEHQLGTTVDFGSPMLENQFHTNFYLTPEGKWLEEHAHEYGFTLSYPLAAYPITQFYYEPWHFRYVGVDLATRLHESNMTLTEYQLLMLPEPCIP